MNVTLVCYGICITCIAIGIFLIRTHSQQIPWRFERQYDVKGGWKYLVKKAKEIKLVRRMKKEKQDKEIYEAIAFLRNMTAIGKSHVSSDFVIQQLAGHKGLLKPVYVKMLSSLRLNQKEAAATIFYEAVGTPISKDFARLLIQWDEIDPEDLTEILLSHQKNIKEIRITEQKRKDELISDLIYFPVVVNVILIFMNFIYVAYFIDQKEMLEMFI